MGRIFEPDFCAAAVTICPAATRDSLFARAMLMPSCAAVRVEWRPAMPTMDAMTRSGWVSLMRVVAAF